MSLIALEPHSSFQQLKDGADRERVYQLPVDPAVYEAAAKAPRNQKDIDARIFRDWIVSTEHIDRDGDIVRREGLSLEHYTGVVLWLHNRDIDQLKIPVAKTLRLKKTKIDGKKALAADMQFAPEALWPAVDAVHQAVVDDLLNGASIGFLIDFDALIPIDGNGKPVDTERRNSWAEVRGFDITRSELMEWSVVPIGSNRQSLLQRLADVQWDKALSVNRKELEDWATDGEIDIVEDNGELMVPVKAPAELLAELADSMRELAASLEKKRDLSDVKLTIDGKDIQGRLEELEADGPDLGEKVEGGVEEPTEDAAELPPPAPLITEAQLVEIGSAALASAQPFQAAFTDVLSGIGDDHGNPTDTGE